MAKPSKWTKEEDALIKGGANLKALCKALPHRSYSAVRARRRYLLDQSSSYQKRPAWTRSEEAVLLRLHPDYAAIQAALPHRTMAAIKERCRTIGGIDIKRRLRWKPHEQQFLETNSASFTSKQLASVLPRRTPIAIRFKRHEIGASAAPKDSDREPTIPLLADIRSRARRLGVTYNALAARAGISRTILRPGMKQDRFSYADAEKAVQELGGHLTVVWPSAD